MIEIYSPAGVLVLLLAVAGAAVLFGAGLVLLALGARVLRERRARQVMGALAPLMRPSGPDQAGTPQERPRGQRYSYPGWDD